MAGPWNLPLVGYMPFFGKHMHKKVAELSQKYGDIIGLKIGSYRYFINYNLEFDHEILKIKLRSVVFLTSLNVIRDTFKDEVFTGRPDFPFFLLRSDNKRGILKCNLKILNLTTKL